jgi:hypothetical protein
MHSADVCLLLSAPQALLELPVELPVLRASTLLRTVRGEVADSGNRACRALAAQLARRCAAAEPAGQSDPEP